ncbi:hypothetical protein Tco_0538626 [Tanacetum coccineum]
MDHTDLRGVYSGFKSRIRRSPLSFISISLSQQKQLFLILDSDGRKGLANSKTDLRYQPLKPRWIPWQIDSPKAQATDKPKAHAVTLKKGVHPKTKVKLGKAKKKTDGAVPDITSCKLQDETVAGRVSEIVDSSASVKNADKRESAAAAKVHADK